MDKTIEPAIIATTRIPNGWALKEAIISLCNSKTTLVVSPHDGQGMPVADRNIQDGKKEESGARNVPHARIKHPVKMIAI